jgi:hypothetical protein
LKASTIFLTSPRLKSLVKQVFQVPISLWFQSLVPKHSRGELVRVLQKQEHKSSVQERSVPNLTLQHLVRQPWQNSESSESKGCLSLFSEVLRPAKQTLSQPCSLTLPSLSCCQEENGPLLSFLDSQAEEYSI